VKNRTFDDLLDQELRDPEVASEYLALAIPDGPDEIMSRILELTRAAVDFSLVDQSVIDQINESLVAAHFPLYWRKAA
jgi:hypothetical protein